MLTPTDAPLDPLEDLTQSEMSVGIPYPPAGLVSSNMTADLLATTCVAGMSTSSANTLSAALWSKRVRDLLVIRHALVFPGDLDDACNRFPQPTRGRLFGELSRGRIPKRFDGHCASLT
jgi:hypothetical protein